MRKYTFLFSFLFTVLVAASVLADEDPIIFYDSFIKVSANAKSLDELKPYLSQRNLDGIKDVPKEEEASVLAFLKELRNTTKRESISSKVEGNTAILTIKAIDTANNNPISATVTLVKENGSWKVDNEDFTEEAVIE